MSMKKAVLSTAVLMALSSGAVHAMGAVAYSSTGNNFTMLGGTGLLTGGTNDVTFEWDGTYRTSVVNDNTWNATLSSPTSFFNYVWTAHNVNIYGAGTYIFNTGCPTGNPSCATPTPATAKYYELVVPTGYVGAHMLFDWNTSANIDVVQLWKLNDSWTASGNGTDPFCAAPNTGGACNTNPNPNGNTASTVWSWVSIDTPASTIHLYTGAVATSEPTENNTYHGTKMVDGPFSGSSANFNVQLVPTPVPAAVWLLGSGLVGLVGVARRRKSV